jgi:hypothetical protein
MMAVISISHVGGNRSRKMRNTRSRMMAVIPYHQNSIKAGEACVFCILPIEQGAEFESE